jgi:hypothetical protein
VGLGLLAGLLGDVDISNFPLDQPLLELPKTEGSKSRQLLVYQQSQREGLTLRQLYLSVAGARGHWRLIGNPSDIAVDLVVPELQRRNLFRTSYEGSTLRENLGLERPGWRFPKTRCDWDGPT